MKCEIITLPLLAGLLLLSGCHKSDWELAKAENEKLKSQITELEGKIKKLQETAQYHFQQGQEQLSAGKFEGAKESFNTVVGSFPNDPLVLSAKKGIAQAKSKQSAAIRKQKREAALKACAGTLEQTGLFFTTAAQQVMGGSRVSTQDLFAICTKFENCEKQCGKRSCQKAVRGQVMNSIVNSCDSVMPQLRQAYGL